MLNMKSPIFLLAFFSLFFESINFPNCPYKQGVDTNNGGCLPCSDNNCNDCDSDFTQCNQCSWGYGLSSGSCLSCTVSLCFDCSANPNICEMCYSGYGLASPTSCLSCVTQDCSSCYSDYLQCQSCDTGFGLSSNVCKPCYLNSPQCLHCSSSLSTCTYCMAGFGPSSGTCTPCLPPCLECPYSLSSCSRCDVGFGVSMGSCVPCTVSNCIQCPTGPNTCTACNQTYGVSTTNPNTCQACKVNHCQICSLNSDVCSECGDGYQLSTVNTCLACAIVNCYRCRSISPCQLCISGWGVFNTTGGGGGKVTTCQKCNLNADPKCIGCAADATKCTKCSTGFGVTPSKKCDKCTQSECLECPQSINNCTVCDITKGINRQSNSPYMGKCDNCVDPNCYDCRHQYRLCEICKDGYGLQSGVSNTLSNPAKCVTCDTNCTKCSGTNNKQCIECIDQYYVDIPSNGLCLQCMENCSVCLDGSTCQECYDGLYSDSRDKQCYECPQYCTLCKFNSFVLKPECSACISGFQLSPATAHPIICREICGDQLAYTSPCDEKKGIAFDGCTDQCTLEDGFVCEVDNATHKSVCSYDRQLQMEILIFSKDRFANKITVKIKVWPPLYLLTQRSPDQVFVVKNPGFKIQSLSYNPSTQQLDFLIDFSIDLIGEPLIIQFVPSESISQQYYATPTSTVYLTQEFIYYEPFGLQSAQFISIICYVILSLGYLSLILGLFTKRLAGLEAMFVIQICYISLVYMNTFLYSPFKEAVLLKMGAGFATKLFDKAPTNNNQTSRLLAAKSKQYSLKYPFTKQFQLDEEMFANNVNIFLFLQCAPILFYLISMIATKILRYMLQNKLQQSFSQQNEAQIARLRHKISNVNTVKQISLQALMYFGLFNLINFTMCSALYFSLNMGRIQMINCIMFGIGCGVYVFNLLLFRFDPDPFDYFRYAFKRDRKSMAYFYIYGLAIISGVLLLCLMPEMAYLPMIPFGVMLMYVIVLRPYREISENVRSIFYLLVILSCLSLRVYIQYVPSENKNIVQAYIIHFSNIVLLLVVTLIAIISIIYHIIYKYYILANMEKTDKEIVMCELDQINVRQKMKNIEMQEDSIFRRILTPRMNLFDFSYQMHKECVKDSEDTRLGLQEKKMHRMGENGENGESVEGEGEGEEVGVGVGEGRRGGLGLDSGLEKIEEENQSQYRSKNASSKEKLKSEEQEQEQEQGKSQKNKKSREYYINTRKIIDSQLENQKKNMRKVSNLQSPTSQKQRQKQVRTKCNTSYDYQNKSNLNDDASDKEKIKKMKEKNDTKFRKCLNENKEKYEFNKDQDLYQQTYRQLKEQQKKEENKKKFALQVVTEERDFIRFKNAKDYTQLKLEREHMQKNKQQFFDAYDEIV